MAVFSIDGHCSGCACSRDKCSDDCATYRSYKPKPTTNADRIRAMTDEELAEWIASYMECGECKINSPKCMASVGACVRQWLDWLKQENANEST